MTDADKSASLAAFGAMVNMMGGGGDRGQVFPSSDAADFVKGARAVPGAVTTARREGKKVIFQQPCSSACCWYWEFEDGTRRYHFDPATYSAIGTRNGRPATKSSAGSDVFEGGAGPCPGCGNEHTAGETVPPKG